jgi:hypothetical protein
VWVLPKATVLPIFWTLRNVGPMSDEGSGGVSRTRILSPACCMTRANKEASDMKRAMFSVLAMVVVAGLTGCITQRGPRPTACMGGSCAQAPENCRQCDDPCDNCKDPGPLARLWARFDGRDPCAGHQCPLQGRAEEEAAPADSGPATGAITYPYYTNRGPRDFLAKSPPSIGP